MISLDSMSIGDIQNTLTLIKTQVTTYKATLTTYKVAYNNAASKLADARQLVENTKNQTETLPSQLPLPASLFGKKAASGSNSVNIAKTISLQNLKTKMEDRISDLEDTIDSLESWQIKLENKLEELNNKAQEYAQQAKAYAIEKATSLASTITTGAEKLITKTVSKGKSKVTTTVSTIPNNDLVK